MDGGTGRRGRKLHNRRREIKGERESKRIEESNRHSNYRSRNEGLMTKNRGGKENKEQEEKKYSKRQQFTERMDQLCRPNYREEEVGALQKDVNRERRREDRGRMNHAGEEEEVKRHKCDRERVAD